MQCSTETVSCNKAACSRQAATGSGESREGALKWSHIILSWRHSARISLHHSACWFQPLDKGSSPICSFHVADILCPPSLRHPIMASIRLNLLSLAVIKDNVIKGFSGKKKKSPCCGSRWPYSWRSMSRGCLLFWPALLLSVGNCHDSSAAELSQRHSRCKVEALQSLLVPLSFGDSTARTLMLLKYSSSALE